ACLAALVPILTWSSWLADDGIESTLAGRASVLFSETSEAALYCIIIAPDSRPGLGLKNDGNASFNWGLTRRSILLSDIFPASAIPSFRKSIASATGCP